MQESGRKEEWESFQNNPNTDTIDFAEFDPGNIATRKSNQKVLDALSSQVGNLVGGSADLTGSNGSYQTNCGDIGSRDFGGRNLFFGVREHGMAAMCNGIALHGGLVPYCATFLTFHDYMRPAVRLSALMKQQVIYIYTHDSVWLGEDGPTHQPIEHAWALRLIPELEVWRPSDALETAAAWAYVLGRDHVFTPAAILLTRQKTAVLERMEDFDPRDMLRGAYIVQDFSYELDEKAAYSLKNPDCPGLVLISTGSEGGATQQLRLELQQLGIPTRHVSMPCIEAMEYEDPSFQDYLFPADSLVVSIEAGIDVFD